MLTIESGGLEITLRNEPTYTPHSADNVRSYGREIPLADARYISSRHGVVVRTAAGEEFSCILLAGAGATTVHEHSALVLDNALYVACGDSICALTLPDLHVRWERSVDPATCFGVYLVPDASGLVAHGELSVARLTLGGTMVWSASGVDIFTGVFAVDAEVVRAVDWHGVPYVFELATGKLRSPEV